MNFEQAKRLQRQIQGRIVKIFETYLCEIKMRETHNGAPIKEVCKILQGQKLLLECLWQCGDDETYPREYAMGGGDHKARSALMSAGIGWLASGDVIIRGNKQ